MIKVFDYFLFLLSLVLWAYGEKDVTFLLFIPLFGLPYLLLVNLYPEFFDTFIIKFVLMVSLIIFCTTVQLKIKKRRS